MGKAKRKRAGESFALWLAANRNAIKEAGLRVASGEIEQQLGWHQHAIFRTRAGKFLCSYWPELLEIVVADGFSGAIKSHGEALELAIAAAGVPREAQRLTASGCGEGRDS